MCLCPWTFPYMPVDDPRANELRNKNLNASEAMPIGTGPSTVGERSVSEIDESEQVPSDLYSSLMQTKMIDLSDMEQSAFSSGDLKELRRSELNGIRFQRIRNSK